MLENSTGDWHRIFILTSNLLAFPHRAAEAEPESGSGGILSEITSRMTAYEEGERMGGIEKEGGTAAPPHESA